MLNWLLSLACLLIVSLFAVDLIGAECHGGSCASTRGARVERVRSVERQAFNRTRSVVRVVFRGR